MPNTAIFLLVIGDSLARSVMVAASQPHAHSRTRMPVSVNVTDGCKALPIHSAVVGSASGSGPAQCADTGNCFDRLRSGRETIIA
jgi:hypothetical protein